LKFTKIKIIEKSNKKMFQWKNEVFGLNIPQRQAGPANNQYGSMALESIRASNHE
jgi:hypothetical protein